MSCIYNPPTPQMRAETIAHNGRPCTNFAFIIFFVLCTITMVTKSSQMLLFSFKDWLPLFLECLEALHTVSSGDYLYGRNSYIIYIITCTHTCMYNNYYYTFMDIHTHTCISSRMCAFHYGQNRQHTIDSETTAVTGEEVPEHSRLLQSSCQYSGRPKEKWA